MKQIIDILQNNFKCGTCYKEFDNITKMNQHIKETHHQDFHLIYGNVLANSGHFHYFQTLLRSYTKLLWNLDYPELANSIHMSSDKAQFSLKKVTNLRKSLDFSRTVRRAKQKELAVPFVKHAREENIEINISNFYSWIQNNAII